MQEKVDIEEKKQVHVHYVRAPIPFVVEENYAGYYNIDDDDDFAQVLQDQEAVYWSLQRNSSINEPRTPSVADSTPNQGQTQGSEQQNQSETLIVQSQIESDEALARTLQELDYESSITSINESTVAGSDSSSNVSSSRSGEGSSGSADRAANEDDVDPDNMTYEELQTLTDAVGTESKGLSDEVISLLPTSTYKIGLFSKKNRRDDRCVICVTAFENRDRLLNLPCQHQYHSTCIRTWLKINKACPICKDEVFGA